MQPDYGQLAIKFGQLLGLAQGMTLKLAHLTRQGMEFVFEDGETRVEVRFLPKVYTEGKVIVDAINDLTMVVQVKRVGAGGVELAGGGRVELPYSTWYDEGDYL